MDGLSPAPRWLASLATLALALVLGWYAFVEERRVPLLGLADLGVHELGHLLFMLGPDLLAATMGNGLQTLLPLLVAAAFAIGRRDWPATGFCLAWAGTTRQDASVYIADAPYQAMPLLFAGTTHDWAYILGPEQLDRLDEAAVISARVHDLGLVVLVAGLATCVLPAVLRQIDRRAADDGGHGMNTTVIVSGAPDVVVSATGLPHGPGASPDPTSPSHAPNQ